MNEGENQLLVRDALVEFEEYNQFKFKTLADHFRRKNLKINKQNLNDVNMKRAGLGNTRMPTDYVQKSLLDIDPYYGTPTTPLTLITWNLAGFF